MTRFLNISTVSKTRPLNRLMVLELAIAFGFDVGAPVF
jgi:hypothetical protein